MDDRLQRGVNRLASRLREHAGRLVVYRRGTQSVVLPATVGRTLLKLTDEYGATRVEWTDRDYLFRAADLVLGGSLATPQRGDVVEDGAERYEVAAPQGEAPWRYSDPRGLIYRVHVKRVT